MNCKCAIVRNKETKCHYCQIYRKVTISRIETEMGFDENLSSHTHYFLRIHTDKFKWHLRLFGNWTIRDKFPSRLYKNGPWVQVVSLTLLRFHCVLSKAESGGGLSWEFTFWRALSKWLLVYFGSPVQLRPVSHINEIQNGYCQELSFIFNVV